MKRFPRHHCWISAFEDDAKKKEECGIVFFTELRNPNGDNVPLATVSNTGKEYTYNVAVVCLEEGMTIREISDRYTSMLGVISNEVKDRYQYGVHPFINKGQVGADNRLASYYLQNEDCITLMKRYYGGCETKDDFEANEFRSTIVRNIWGDEATGMEVLQMISQDDWYNY